MMNNGKKPSIFLPIVCMLLFGFMTAFLITTKSDVLFDNPKDFYELLEEGNLENDTYVSIKIDAVFGNYAEMQHTWNFIPVGTDQYYMIWLDDDTTISISTKNKKVIEKLDEMTDATWDYADGTTDELPEAIVLKGVISTLDSEIAGYYKEAGDTSNISDYLTMRKTNIDCTETPFGMWCYLVFAAVLTIGSIAMLIANIKKRKEWDTPMTVTIENADI